MEASTASMFGHNEMHIDTGIVNALACIVPARSALQKILSESLSSIYCARFTL